MPDLRTACDALTAWARGQCWRCKYTDDPKGEAPQDPDNPYDLPPHTCHKYIELARDVAVAAVERLEYQELDIVPPTSTPFRLLVVDIIAELKRLLGEPTDG